MSYQDQISPCPNDPLLPNLLCTCNGIAEIGHKRIDKWAETLLVEVKLLKFWD